jgi:hypothetical protein
VVREEGAALSRPASGRDAARSPPYGREMSIDERDPDNDCSRLTRRDFDA